MSAPVEPLRDVIARHGLSASKSLGQNFILDRQLLARVAAVPGSLQGSQVYEVGPGPGGLTKALLQLLDLAETNDVGELLEGW